MARKRSLWTEWQREVARRRRLEEQQRLAREREVRRQIQAEQQAARAAARKAEVDEKERKRLYIEDRKAEVASMVAELQARVAELDSVLVAGIRPGPAVTFTALKQSPAFPSFDAGGMDRPTTQPEWEQFAPAPPSGLGRLFGGSGRHERQEASAREAYDQACAQHAASEADRLRRLAERRREYERQAAAAADAAAALSAEVDQFERDFRAGEPEAVAQFCTLALNSSVYPERFAHRTRVLNRPGPKEVVVEFELPPQSVIPAERDYKYVMARDEITPVARPVKEIKDRYARPMPRS
jgi:restriction system protein